MSWPEYIVQIEPHEEGELYHLRGEPEPIVRCRDCESCDKDKWECKRTYVDCGVYMSETVYLHPDVDPDGFCSWGERADS